MGDGTRSLGERLCGMPQAQFAHILGKRHMQMLLEKARQVADRQIFLLRNIRQAEFLIPVFVDKLQHAPQALHRGFPMEPVWIVHRKAGLQQAEQLDGGACTGSLSAAALKKILENLGILFTKRVVFQAIA